MLRKELQRLLDGLRHRGKVVTRHGSRHDIQA